MWKEGRNIKRIRMPPYPPQGPAFVHALINLLWSPNFRKWSQEFCAERKKNSDTLSNP